MYHPQMKKILSMLDENLEVKTARLISEDLRRPESDRVLREIQRNRWVLVPSTNAIALVLRSKFGLDNNRREILDESSRIASELNEDHPQDSG